MTLFTGRSLALATGVDVRLGPHSGDPDVIVDATIAGNPVPWVRQATTIRNGRVVHFTDREYRARQDELAAILRALVRRPESSLDVDLVLEFARADRRRVDLDNLEKHVLDSANGILWRDDSQVVAVRKTKLLGCGPGAHTRIYARRVVGLHPPGDEDDPPDGV